MRKGPLPTLPYFPQRPFLALVKLCFANRTLPNARTASRLTVRKALLEACKNPRQGVSKMSLPDAVRACPMPFCPAPPFSPGHLSFPGPHLPGSPPPTAAPWGADSCGPAPRDSSLLRNFPLKIPPAVSRPPREVLLSEASSHPVPPAHSALVWEPRSPTSMSAAVAPAAVHPDSMLSEAEEPKEGTPAQPLDSAKFSAGMWRKAGAVADGSSKRAVGNFVSFPAWLELESRQPCPSKQAAKGRGSQHQT